MLDQVKLTGNFYFSFLNESHIQKIVELRKASFERHFHDDVKTSGLEWNLLDQKSTHLGIFSGDELVSCLRVNTFTNAQKLEEATQITTPKEVFFPCVLLSRAATHHSYNDLGLHGQLRCFALQIACHFKIFCILGSLQEKSSRLQTLLKLDYKILAREEHWKKSYLKNSGPVILIGLMNQASVEKAIETLRKKHQLPILQKFTSLI